MDRSADRIAEPGRFMKRLIAIAAIYASLLAAVPVGAQTDVTAAHPMIDAAAIGNSDVVEYWLKRGVRVDYADPDGRTALIFGAFNGSMEIVELTLSLGALVNRTDKGGSSAIIWAASQGHL